MELLERGAELTRLEELAGHAVSGDGAMALVGGEAGVGKTSLARALASNPPRGLRPLVGRCDPLDTPVPLGPFEDMAATNPQAQALLDAAGPDQRLAQLRALLRGPRLLVVDDAHWMDDATADLLVHAGRRIEQTSSLVLVTHRTERHEQSQALTRLLAALGTAGGVHRLTLAPLSVEGVAALAAGQVSDPVELHARTGGNPFYVSEVLADPADSVPVTVAAAVLARAGSLSPTGRELLDLASLAPGGLEYHLAVAILGAGPAADGLDETARRGMVSLVGSTIVFRHDLAREAVVDAVPASERLRGHRQLIEAMESMDEPNPARLVHHSLAVGDDERLGRYGPQAARDASKRGAHRAAAAHHQTVLDRASLNTHERAEMLEALAVESEWFSTARENARLREDAAAGFRAAGEPAREALQLLAVMRDRKVAGESRGDEYVGRIQGLIADLPVDEVVADVMLGLVGVRCDHEPPAAWVADAHEMVDVGEQVGAPMVQAWALEREAFGSIRLGHLEHGLRVADRALRVAQHASPDHVLWFAANFSVVLCEVHALEQAEEMVERGLAATGGRDDDKFRGQAETVVMRVAVHRGDWDAALDVADGLGDPKQSAVMRAFGTWGEGLVAARRGDGRATDLLATAAEAMEPAQRLDIVWPCAAARAEAAWLAGDLEPIPDLIESALETARKLEHPWAIGELAHWNWRAGRSVDPENADGTPWALMMAGEPESAAAAWQELNSPYLEALALADGDEDAQRRAIEIADELGAEPLADRVRWQLREAGATGVPTRRRVHGDDLTRRQLDVLRLIAHGLSNAQIGERLFISPKTVSHHVSAILERLDAGNRTEAASRAREEGMLD